jgi:peptidoglycan/LPS O-acetylase OafA/YrhL
MSAERRRVVGLDGIRGLAALFVVLNHVYLRAYPGYPDNHAPFWADPFIYGRFAVVVFIVLSGFSLSIAPARSQWRLDGVRRFAHRRAWRILPPYWAAMVFSLLMTWFVVAQPGWPIPTGRSIWVNGLLLQDVIVVPSPNRTFWSIAIEAQLYIVFPLLILMMRRLSSVVMLAAVTTPVVYLGLRSQHGDQHAASLILQYTPDLAVLFAIGVAAARIVSAGDRWRRLPWHWFALLLAAPVFAIIAARGSAWTLDDQRLFWVDMALGPAIGCLLAAIATQRPAHVVRALNSRPLRSLGSFSYSLYLTHGPIVIAIYYGLMYGKLPLGAPTFFLLGATAVPATVLFARLFAEVFELPFVRRRGWVAVRDALHLPWPMPSPRVVALQTVPGAIAIEHDPGRLGQALPDDAVALGRTREPL